MYIYLTCISSSFPIDRALLFGGVVDTEGPRYVGSSTISIYSFYAFNHCYSQEHILHALVFSLPDIWSRARFLMIFMLLTWREGSIY